jgi:hypothetical protein
VVNRRHARRLAGWPVRVLGGLLLIVLLSAADDGRPDISPSLECVAANPDGTLTARFGWDNDSGMVLLVDRGRDNFTLPTRYSDRLPLEFSAGTTPAAGGFTITFPQTEMVVWTLYGQATIASAASPRCPDVPAGPGFGPTPTAGVPAPPPSTSVGSVTSPPPRAADPTTQTTAAPTAPSSRPDPDPAPAPATDPGEPPSSARPPGALNPASASGPPPPAAFTVADLVPALIVGFAVLLVGLAGAVSASRYPPRH